MTDEITGRDTATFIGGLLLGAAIGAGVALLLAPASGERTRKLLRRRARGIQREAAKGWISARDEAGRQLRKRKDALRDRLEEGLDVVEERLRR